MRANITMKIGAAYDTVTAFGHSVDRSKMDKDERRKFNNQVVDTWSEDHGKMKERRADRRAKAKKWAEKQARARGDAE